MSQQLPDRVETPRLLLRRWGPGDVDALADAITVSVEHLRPWMPWIAHEPTTREQRLDLIRQWQADWESGGDVVVGILLDGEVVGGSGLHRRGGPETLEIGYWIHVDHIGRGYATEVASALTSAAFTVAGIERVEIHHDKANTSSGAVPRRLGFQMVGERPVEVTSPGEIGIHCQWSVTRDEWVSRPDPAADGVERHR